MNLNLEFNLLTVGIVATATAILGFVVYFQNTKSATNKAFLFFTLITLCWGVINYASYNVISTELAFKLLRGVMFFAVFQALSFFHLFYVFPDEKIIFSKTYKFALVPMVVIMAILTLTPWILEKVIEVGVDGQILKVANGPAMILFGLLNVSLVMAAFVTLIKKLKNSIGVNRIQLWYFLSGSVITFILIIIFNFIFPALLNNPNFIPFGALFIFPFIIATTYAILKHHLLDIRVITTEILAFLVTVFAFIEVIIPQSFGERLLRIWIFIILLFASILLIRSVRKQVEQRIELQKLSDELYKANQKLKQFDLQKTEFLSTTSHQLRTPLSGIKGYLSMMADGDFGPFSEEQSGIIKRVKDEVDRLVRMVQDFLNVSRIESGRLELNMTEFDIVELVKTVIKELEPSAKTRGLKINLDTTKDNIQVKADPDKLKDVIVNLTDNAIKYTEKGRVWVEVSCTPNQQVKVAVHDSGVGVDPEEIGKLFVKFQRAKDIARVSASGTGLGLFVAKKIIGAHKGEIWAESKGKGQGSTFIFKIPSNC